MNERYYQHVDGGLYRFVCQAKHADNLEPHVVYEHIWPFEQAHWVRRSSEFSQRFSLISAEEVAEAMKGDQEAARLSVVKAKALRRNEEAQTE